METSKINAMAIAAPGNAPTAVGSRVWQILTLDDRLGRRAAVVIWLAAGIGLGLFAGWTWIVAAGLSTVVLAILPCAVMCALGLCGGSAGKKCADKNAPSAPSDTNA